MVATRAGVIHGISRFNTHHHIQLDLNVMADIPSMTQTISRLIAERAELKLQHQQFIQQAEEAKDTLLREQASRTSRDMASTAVLKSQLEEAKQNEQVLRAQLAGLEQKASDWRHSSDTLLLERRDLLTRIASQDQLISDLQSQRASSSSSSTNQNDPSRDDLERTRKLLEEKQDIIESLSISLSEAKSRQIKVENTLESSRAMYDSQLQGERQGRAALEAELKSSLTQVASLANVNEALSSENVTLASSLKEADLAKSTMALQISELSSALEGQRTSVDRAQRQSEALNASSERSQKLLNENKMLIAQLAELRERTIELNNEKLALADELESEKRRANGLQSQLSSTTLNGISSSDPVVDVQAMERLQIEIARYKVELQVGSPTLLVMYHRRHVNGCSPDLIARIHPSLETAVSD